MSAGGEAMSRFCDNCEIAMSMHDDPDDCEGAIERVERLEQMERLFILGVMGR